MPAPDTEFIRLRRPGADFDLVEPLVTPSAARGYLIMSGQVISQQARGEPESLRLVNVNAWSCAAYAIYRSGEPQLFSDAFQNVAEDSPPFDQSGLVISSEDPVRANPALSCSNVLLRRFGQALVEEYDFHDDPSQPTAMAA